MKKKLISYFTILSILTSPFLYSDGEDPFIDEELQEELFNRGRIVGEEPQDIIQAQKRARWTNWSMALTSVAAGVTALVLVKQHHNHK